MPYPVQVEYIQIGNKKQRNVIGLYVPKPINFLLGFAQPIRADMGDVEVNWDETSAGLNLVLEAIMLRGFVMSNSGNIV